MWKITEMRQPQLSSDLIRIMEQRLSAIEHRTGSLLNLINQVILITVVEIIIGLPFIFSFCVFFWWWYWRGSLWNLKEHLQRNCCYFVVLNEDSQKRHRQSMRGPIKSWGNSVAVWTLLLTWGPSRRYRHCYYYSLLNNCCCVLLSVLILLFFCWKCSWAISNCEYVKILLESWCLISCINSWWDFRVDTAHV